MTARILVCLVMILIAASGLAQAPHEDWRTLTTDHFRIHYPKQYEEWTRHVAGKLEEVRSLVTPVVGYEPSEITDVIVADPLAMPNGSAWPFIGSPRMVLWASAPGPGSILSHQADWAELVAIHEDAHLVHLLRPTRSRFRALAWVSSPVRLGPVAGAPRWVSEGYATVIEGQLTGMGRPHSDMRASILRRWAQEGRLPSYSRLASDSSTWLGQSMAYLVGSAYLEWLLEREGDESLKALWSRLTARQSRTFDEAFEGVYGDSPQRLYQRFTAELTQRAMTVEAALAPSLREGEMFQDYSWFTEVPDLSADGTMLVTVRRPRDGPAALVVLSTERDTEVEEKRQKRIDEMLRKDPEDVAPVLRKPLERTPKYRLARTSGAVPQTPRWIAETGEVMFVEFVPDINGVMHPDVFRWNPNDGVVRRLTVGADLRDAVPMAKGAEAVAVRQRYGASQLVRVNFDSGEITPLTEPSIVEVCGNPRVSPDATQLAYVVQREGRWHLVVRDLASGEEISRTLEGTVAHPAWSPDGSKLYASVGADGFVDIREFVVEGGAISEGRQITRSSTALFGPTAGLREIYFLGMDADGIDLRRLDRAASEAPLPPVDLPPALAPAVRVIPEGIRESLTPRPLGEDLPYGLGRQELSPLFGGSWAASGGTFEFGARLGDVVGRTEVVALGSVSSGGAASGGVLSAVTRRWPVVLATSVLAIDEQPSEQEFDDPFGPIIPDRDRVAIEVEGSRTLRWRPGSLTIASGGYWSDIEPDGSEGVDQWGVFGRAAFAGKPTSGSWSYPLNASLDLATGSTDSESFTRFVGRLSFGVAYKRNGVEIEAEYGDVGEDTHPLDRFEVGGLRTSLHAGSAVFGNRVFVPGLPYGVLEGTSFTRLRGALLPSFMPMKLFYERIETSSRSGDASIDSAGIEVEMSVESMPLVRIPNVTISLGAVVVLDAPLEDEVKGWIGLRWGR